LSAPESRYEGEGIETLVNGQKGMPDFYRDPAWIGFRNNPLEAEFTFARETAIKTITISYARNLWAMCMPPREVEVWGGNDRTNMKLIYKGKAVQPDTWVSNRIEGFSFDLSATGFEYYKLIAHPLSRLPEFRKEKKEKGWLMVDEIFFN
jgi:hypothetical protein